MTLFYKAFCQEVCLWWRDSTISIKSPKPND